MGPPASQPSPEQLQPISVALANTVSLAYGPDGKRIRRKVFGKTKQEVRYRLKALHQELNAGVRSSPAFARTAVLQ